MSLTLTYCEIFRRSLWGLKNNQTQNPDFFVAIKSNLDVCPGGVKGYLLKVSGLGTPNGSSRNFNKGFQSILPEITHISAQYL
jgi:hypothetical protein